MDSWYGSVENLKLITKKLEWHFACSLKSNRKVGIAKDLYVSISDLVFTNKQVRKVWLKEYGYALACKIVDKKATLHTYLATSDLNLLDYDSYVEHFIIAGR